jgi:hypothetical protein
MDGRQPQIEEEMPHSGSGLVQRWSVVVSLSLARLYSSLTLTADYLQTRLARETSEPVFSDLPFRFAEISKVLLDV